MKYNNQLLRKTIMITSIVCLVCFAYIGSAHDAWVDPAKGPTYKIFYGHKKPEAYVLNKITSIMVMDAQQKSLNFSRIEKKEGLSIKVKAGKPAIFALEFDNGYWVKVGDQSINSRKSQMPAGTDPARVLKFSKTITTWLPWMKQPLGQRFELVPISFKETPKSGAQLELQLLLDGKPLGGQMVENNSNEEGPKTNEEGRVTVTVLKGINRFATDYNIIQTTDPDATRLSLTAALVFLAN